MICYILYDDMALSIRSRVLHINVPPGSTDAIGVPPPGVEAFTNSFAWNILGNLDGYIRL